MDGPEGWMDLRTLSPGGSDGPADSMPNYMVILPPNLFKHNFCIKPCVPREPQRDPNNRRHLINPL